MNSLKRLLFQLFVALGWVLAVSPGAAQSDTRALVVVVEPGASGLDPAAVREAVARELGVSVVERSVSGARGTLSVNAGSSELSLSYRAADGRELTRVVPLPATDQARLDVIALLAGNLVRDEADELVKSLRPGESPAAAPPPTTSGSDVSAPVGAPKPAAKSAPPKPTKPTPRKPRAPPSAAGKSKTSARDRVRLLPLNLSLFHPLALYRHSERSDFVVEFGLFYGRVRGVHGVGFNAGVLRLDDDAEGATASGIWTWSHGNFAGASASGIFATSSGSLEGAEAAGVFLLRSGDVAGAQAAGVFDYAARVRGVQAAGVFVRGADVAGVQVAGAVTLARELKGVQAAGGLNLAQGPVSGVQAAPLNIAGDTAGVQLGVLNIAGEVEGAMLGLVNVADRVDGVSLAPISILKQNRTHALLWSDTVALANAAVKYSTGRFYTQFGVGGDPREEPDRSFVGGGGLGVHSEPFEAAMLDFDVLYRYVLEESASEEDRHSTAYRVVAGYAVSDLLSVFATGGVEHWAAQKHHAAPYAGVGVQLF